MLVRENILELTGFDVELPRTPFVKNDAFHADLLDFRTTDISDTKQTAAFFLSNTVLYCYVSPKGEPPQ